MRSIVSLLALMLLANVGCEGGVRSDASDDVVTLFAAASTGDAIEEVNKRFAERTGVAVRTSAAASSTLAQQIEHGAAADLFLSANVKWCDYVEEKQLIAKRCDLLGNRLAIVVAKSGVHEVRSPQGLLAEEVQHLALGEPHAVPAGIYARQALERLRLWDRLQQKVVSAKDVRTALAYVETGAAEAGVVYATDAAASRSVEIACLFPEDLTEPIVYPVALLKSAEANPAAVEYFAFLTSPQAAQVFAAHGFTTALPPSDGEP